MKLVKLTTPEGDPVFVNPEAVQTVRLNSGEAIATAKAVLVLASGGIQGVLELPAAVVGKLVDTPEA